MSRGLGDVYKRQALIGQRLGYDFSGDDLLRFNGQKVDKVTVRKVDHPGEYH